MKSVWARQQRLRFDDEFVAFFERQSDDIPADLLAAMRYSSLNGGKRLRPLLVYATGRLFSVPLKVLDDVSIAIECVHVYSLIHDDLPAMDNDDYRRGQATCHRAFDEATAILAGDALQALAFEQLTDIELISDTAKINMIKQLSYAAGAAGMVGGQSRDLSNTQSTLSELNALHRQKTGALIAAAVMLPTYADTCCSTEQRSQLHHYAQALGLAFQIQDDLLDVVGNSHTLGKTVGKDQQIGKCTYPALLGLQSAQLAAQQQIEEALAALNDFGEVAAPLRDIARFVILRQH